MTDRGTRFCETNRSMKLCLALCILASSLVIQALWQLSDNGSAPDEDALAFDDQLPSSEDLEEGFLEKFGLASVPDVSKLNTTQAEVSKVYHEYWSSPGEKIPIDEPRLWTLEASEEARTNSGAEEDGLKLTFDLEEKAKTEKMDLSIWSARLASLKLKVESDGWNRGYLILYDQTNSTGEHLETKQVEANAEGLDVTVPVSQHLVMGRGRIVFYVRCHGCRVSSPTLEILLVSEERSNWWRGNEVELLDCPADGRDSKCCRNGMTVSIKDIPRMNFVLHPLEFEAFRCEGHCPHEHRAASNHAILQSLVRRQDQKAGRHPVTPEPCCAPKTLKDLDIIYLDDGNTIRKGTWKEVIVQDCACS
ncbi:unnamed protein product [Darwinula stevensoni]|uniref:TGF-beta family profile domain-containing protein n=1 Tax=Darwinula stevensoni TaxID=69355 RepID=A0A7R8XFV6_9CRUS|nr:unnamed protein product [Darwinula stevensoni]CAG0891951.1 unnamed protein product [Darwinula stevensoni]